MSTIGRIPKSQLYSASFFNEREEEARRKEKFEEEATFVDEAAMADAAKAIREVEVEAAEPDVSDLNWKSCSA